MKATIIHDEYRVKARLQPALLFALPLGLAFGLAGALVAGSLPDVWRLATGALVTVATEGDKEVANIADHVFFVPAAPELLLPIVEVIPLQLFAYHVAVRKGYDVDHPRNLVKAVVVE